MILILSPFSKFLSIGIELTYCKICQQTQETSCVCFFLRRFRRLTDSGWRCCRFLSGVAARQPEKITVSAKLRAKSAETRQHFYTNRNIKFKINDLF